MTSAISQKSRQKFSAPCEKCTSFWVEANSLRKLPILRLLDFGTPPIPEQAAVWHLGRDHGLGASEFQGVGGVWLCGILSGLTTSEGITGHTFEEKVMNEIAHRERLYRLTLDNMRMAHLWLRYVGILTPEGVRAGALKLDKDFESSEGAAALGVSMMRVITTYAYRAACRSVVPP